MPGLVGAFPQGTESERAADRGRQPATGPKTGNPQLRRKRSAEHAGPMDSVFSAAFSPDFAGEIPPDSDVSRRLSRSEGFEKN